MNYHFLKSPIEFLFIPSLSSPAWTSPPGINGKVVYKRLGKDYTTRVRIYHIGKKRPKWIKKPYTSLKTVLWSQHLQGLEIHCLQHLWEKPRGPYIKVTPQGSVLSFLFILLLGWWLPGKAEHLPVSHSTTTPADLSLISLGAPAYIVFITKTGKWFSHKSVSIWCIICMLSQNDQFLPPQIFVKYPPCAGHQDMPKRSICLLCNIS